MYTGSCHGNGKVTDEWFMELSHKYEVERMELKEKIAECKQKLEDLNKQQHRKDAFLAAVRKFMEMRTLTNQILRELIDHIDVYEVEGRGKNRTQRMVIYYKFVGYLEIPSHLSAPNYKADLRQGVAVEYVSCEPTDSARELFDEDCEPVKEEQ